MQRTYVKHTPAFTIVELLIVIIVIAILAAISLVAYNGIQVSAGATVLKSDLKNAATQLGILHTENEQYPGTDNTTTDATSVPSLRKSAGTTFQYTRSNDGQSYCLTATSNKSGVPAFYISSTTQTPQEGTCTGHSGSSGGGGSGGNVADGATMQAITTENCPTTRTRVVDARDDHTYWIQKLADDKCWMLTNLSYAGGGADTHGDTKTLINGSADTERTYTIAKYYVPSGANPTAGSVNPSISTDGGVTNPQYGYYYNWCAAMGGQDTAACANATAPTPNPSISICPAGWRLPTASDFVLLNNTVNNGSNSNDEGMRNAWLMQYAGAWGASYIVSFEPGTIASYHTSEQGTATSQKILYGSTYSYPGSFDPNSAADKNQGHALRCML